MDWSGVIVLPVSARLKAVLYTNSLVKSNEPHYKREKNFFGIYFEKNTQNVIVAAA